MTTPLSNASPGSLDCWGILEVMGHLRLAGRLSEQVIAGAGFVRVDVPATRDAEAYSRMFGPTSIYSICPTSEEIARAMAERLRAVPIEPYLFPDSSRPSSVPRIHVGFQEFEDVDDA